TYEITTRTPALNMSSGGGCKVWADCSCGPSCSCGDSCTCGTVKQTKKSTSRSAGDCPCGDKCGCTGTTCTRTDNGCCGCGCGNK
ncbi:unnamed protein product, partial [Pylaiella littoralis]